jgi:hypothetical protein
MKVDLSIASGSLPRRAMAYGSWTQDQHDEGGCVHALARNQIQQVEEDHSRGWRGIRLEGSDALGLAGVEDLKIGVA